MVLRRTTSMKRKCRAKKICIRIIIKIKSITAIRVMETIETVPSKAIDRKDSPKRRKMEIF